MKKRLLLFIFITIVCGVFWANNDVAQAGFGISPPFIRTKNPIFPGSQFTQKITLLRSSAEDVLEAKVTIRAPEIEEWISIDKGLIFELPEGKLQVPIIVTIDVPDDAEIGNYTGNFSVQISPKENTRGGVAIALGARVDIDLQISNEEFIDFLIRKVSIPEIETLKAPWKWPIFSWFFYRLKVAVRIENIGNVDVAPSKVQLDVYDLTEKNLLESHEDKRINKVEPLQTNTVMATFPTKLPPGEYWGRTRVYKENDIIHKDKLIFTVFANGKLPGGTKLGPWPWVMLGSMILIILGILLFLIKIKIWRYIFKLLYILSWPFRKIGKVIIAAAKKINVGFWRWMHKKSAKYSKGEENNISKNQTDEED